MSSHACNYCLYQYYLKEYGDKVTTQPKEIKGVGTGVDVFVDGKWVSWFMKLPDHCCC